MNLSHLSTFQLILLVTFTLLFLGSIAAMVRGWAGRREGLVWIAVWLAGGVAILWPQVTSQIAGVLGIGRGADLVFYCAVVIMLIGFWIAYIHLRRVRREITLLVRHQALLEAERQQSKADDTVTSKNSSDLDAADTGNSSGCEEQ